MNQPTPTRSWVAFDIELEVLLLTEGLREKGLPPQRLTLSNSLSMYWTVAQMVA
ncbi:hypothetical protein IGA71_21300, partial [Pseudomonas aeruginosa]|nr:hypothetical protein [Pseudomonas aeruginosa]